MRKDGVVFFDGAARMGEGCGGSGAVAMPPAEPLLCEYTAHYFPAPTTNNIAEYDGLIHGLQLAADMGFTHLTIFGDSQLLSAWCSPVNPVLKPDGRKTLKAADQWTDDDMLKNYRLTNDFRVVDSTIKPKAGTMPFQATIFPLHEDNWDMLSSMLNGCSTNEECYQDMLFKNMLIWIDDIFVYAENLEAYVVALEKFFNRVAHFGFIGEGVKQDPERIQHLCAVAYPTNAGDFQQFVCSVHWLRDSMTEYAQTVDLLQQCLTKALEGKGKKKRIASVKSKLRASVELTHLRENATMCLFTDATDYSWLIVVTQVVEFNKATAIQEQHHELLLCQSKLNYLLVRPTGFRMYCDHKSLLHVFAPGEEWKARTRGKLMRWAAIIGGYRYDIVHIVVHNVWVDMMSRWGQPTPILVTKRVLVRRGHNWTKKRRLTKTKKAARPQRKLHPLNDDFVWPCVDDIRQAYSGAKYVLVLKDDLTHYCELVACDDPTSQVCVDALVDWSKRFGIPRVWVSDQGTHFKIVAMKALAHRFKKDIQKNINELRTTLHAMHKEVLNRNEQQTSKAAKATELSTPAAVDERYHPKLLITWVGSYRVKSVGEFSVTHEEREAQTSRVKMYAEASIEFLPDVSDFMVEVFWEGFEDIESSWEPLKKLMRKCQVVVKAYVLAKKNAEDH
ncbi:hypothetical protein H257_14710 [Aphanomyces astaci]|uniref:RNase H type-1 domain-containing protein n=1 Tax=Aphanomyces astaci TaxID=112090 RepID=W4FQ30_APHAT|nr:hypothetical protein H257_14710 [Aphanomyces astaci]ETV69577.1 hypothetical protein H257_14710 [Aphanomyces astaci]|eukprot:XP_009840904.1 hypothetical protein H257_14710 [Aphanomyces astaci]